MLLALSSSVLNNIINIQHMLLINSYSSQCKGVPSLGTIFLSLNYNIILTEFTVYSSEKVMSKACPYLEASTITL